jgi:hypothetical protein
MARSRRMTLALGGAALLLGLGLVSACSSPTAVPGGVPGQPVDGSSGFDLPPGPVNVPPGGQESGYPGDSLQRFPTARSPYPAPDEADVPAPDEADEAAEGQDAETEPEPDEATPEPGG